MLDQILLSIISLNNKPFDDFATSQIKNLNFFENRKIVIDVKKNSLDFLNLVKIDKDSLGISTNVKSGIVFDYDTGKILWKKNEEEIRSVASITKLMTVLVFLEDFNIDLDSYFKITNDVLITDINGAAVVGVGINDSIKIKDLLYSGYIGSKNDSINALVKSTGVSYDDFVKKMNEKAKILNLKNTNFTNVNGLDSNNKSTALDIGKLSYHAFNNKVIREMSSIEKYTFVSSKGKKYSVNNTDKLINNPYFDVVAAKTGYLDTAGYCLSLMSYKNKRKIISVLLGNPTDEDRFFNAEMLNWWGYTNFKYEIKN